MCINNYPAGFGPVLHLLPCFVYGIREGAGEAIDMDRLAVSLYPTLDGV